MEGDGAHESQHWDELFSVEDAASKLEVDVGDGDAQGKHVPTPEEWLSAQQLEAVDFRRTLFDVRK